MSTRRIARRSDHQFGAWRPTQGSVISAACLPPIIPIRISLSVCWRGWKRAKTKWLHYSRNSSVCAPRILLETIIEIAPTNWSAPVAMRALPVNATNSLLPLQHRTKPMNQHRVLRRRSAAGSAPSTFTATTTLCRPNQRNNFNPCARSILSSGAARAT